MKNLFLTAALIFSPGGGYAGNLQYEAPAEPQVIIDQPGSMGGSGAWLVPLPALGLVALSVSQGDDDTDEPDDTPVPCEDDQNCYTPPEPCVE